MAAKYDAENQLNKYIDITDKLTRQEALTDIEYLQYPDILHKHIDCQMLLIADRIKNLKVFGNYLNDVGQLLDAVHKNLIKIIKESVKYI